MNAPIYLDHNATTPCHPEVVSAMLPFFSDTYGNPSSEHHAYGWLARDVIANTTESIAKAFRVLPKELIYTSGATESINMILKGIVHMFKEKGDHIITCKTEHKAILDTCMFLENEGISVTYLDVDSEGIIRLDELEKALNSKTILVAIMYANNETGVLQPLQEISALTKANDSLLFSDATQALGKIALDHFFEWVDFSCFSAHKIYGPKGVGLTYIKEPFVNRFKSFIQGGGQQRGLRGGTLNTPGIVGLGKAVALCYNDLSDYATQQKELRDYLEKSLLAIDCTHLNGNITQRLPNTTNVSFDFVDGASLLRALGSTVAVSNGSACNSSAVNPSHVLRAMGVSSELAFASLRLGLGRYTTKADIDNAIRQIRTVVAQLREENILWELRK